MKKYLPMIVIAAGAAAGFVFFGEYLSFEALERNNQTLAEWRDRNFALTALVFAAVYCIAVAFSFPGAVWLTLLGGFLFGTIFGGIVVVLSATAGAMILFLAARTSFGDLLRSRADSWISKLEDQFRDGEVSFLLILRLVPLAPFFVVNLVPAFLGVRLFTFFWTTLVGIIPGTMVYTSIGAGLEEQFSRGEAPDLGVIFEPHILGPLLGLAFLAVLPLILKKFGLMGKNR